MFLSERELKETFWKNYNYSSRAKRYQFEVPIREGNADLVTVEVFQGDVQFEVHPKSWTQTNFWRCTFL